MQLSRKSLLILPLLLAAVAPAPAAAQTAADAIFTVNNVWMMVATFLVFIMHMGFSTLEIGLTQSKNTVNILFKNVSIIAIGLLTYAIVGFNLMYPGEFSIGSFFGFAGFGIGTDAAGLTSEYSEGYTYWTDFLFQGMFAATAATIVSGAVAERIKLASFLVFATLYVGLIYPFVGSWKWGGGWLDEMGFYDFAGSTLVHSVGGWAALVGVFLLGPRLGKYVNEHADQCSPSPDRVHQRVPSWTPPREVRERSNSPDPGPQHPPGRHRDVHALAGLVRLQRRVRAQRRSGARIPRLGDDLPCRQRGDRFGHVDDVDRP